MLSLISRSLSCCRPRCSPLQMGFILSASISNPPASLPPSCAATAAAAARTGAPPGVLTNAQTASEPAAAMRSAGEEDEDEVDDDDDEGEGASTATAATAAAVDALIALGDCGCPLDSGAAARTTAGLFSICVTARRAEGAFGRWMSRRGGRARLVVAVVVEQRRMPVAVDIIISPRFAVLLSSPFFYYVLIRA